MGQPTHGITQRVGKAQLWQHVAFFSATETSYGENLFKLQLGSKLATLFFLSLVLLPKHNFWLSSIEQRKFFFNSRGWYSHIRYLPQHTTNRVVFTKYFERQTAKPLFRDGETTVFSLSYTHRKLRLVDVFWCQPRCFRLENGLFLLLRAVSVIQPRAKLKRTRSIKINRLLKKALKVEKMVTSTQNLNYAWF
jgi:hypothetical protein